MRWRLAALAAALVLAGCGEKAEPTGSNSGGGREPFTVILDYLPNADHAGIYAARAEGLYAKANLDVKVVVPPDASSPLKLLKAGRADVAISYEPELLLARDAGAESLVSVAALVQEPLTSLMALPSANVHSAGDLAGKRVGTAGIAYQHAYLQTILQHAGVDAGSVKETSVGFNLVPAMVSKKVAATLGAYWNYEGIQLRQKGRDPRIIRIEQAGVPTYDELVIVATDSEVRDHPDRIRKFLKALAEGTDRLDEHPGDALLAANKDLDPALQRASVKATLPYFKPKPGRPYGYMDPGEWGLFTGFMHSNGLLKLTSPDDAFTNELLP
jgi:putative hydroxymethylpyrimidine transport system substrate-binding protein